MINLIEKMLAASTGKAAFIILLSAIWQFIAPIGDFIFLIVFLLIADFITGIWAASKRGETINSKGFRRSFQKIVVYALSLIGAEYIRIIMFKELQLNVAYPIAMLIVITEFKSISENTLTITGVDIWERIKDLFPEKK